MQTHGATGKYAIRERKQQKIKHHIYREPNTELKGNTRKKKKTNAMSSHRVIHVVTGRQMLMWRSKSQYMEK